MVPQLWLQMILQVVNSSSVAYILKKSQTLNCNHLLLQEMCITIAMLELREWSTLHVCLIEISQEKHLKLSDYLNQTHLNQGHLATLSALQCFGFFWTSAAKTTSLQEFTGCFRTTLSPDTQNRIFAKNGSCIQLLDTTLHIYPNSLCWLKVQLCISLNQGDCHMSELFSWAENQNI